jgi:ferritin-like metal-binding protein YciE
MTTDDLREILTDQIKDLYDAEKQLVKALPKLAQAASCGELSEAITSHLTETQTHVSRLEEVFNALGIPSKGKPCKAMKGLLEEGNEAIQENETGELRDIAIIAGSQRVEHYEISAYGTARTLAEKLELEDVVDLLQQTEEEEKAADEKLTEVAVGIYEKAEESGQEAEEEENATAAKPATRRAGGR